MAWIKTIPFTEAGEALLEALEAQHKLYPKEYARTPGDDGSKSIVATHSRSRTRSITPSPPSACSCRRSCRSPGPSTR
jgi:hypothetical protein